MKIVQSVVLCVFIWTTSGYPKDYVEEVFYWKNVGYENLPRSESSYVGPYRYYIPENNDIIGTSYHPASGLMLTVNVRIRPGVPTSLGAFCVNDYKHGSSPKIWGFPNWEINTLWDSDFAAGPLEDQGRRETVIKVSTESEISSEEEEAERRLITPKKHNQGNHHYVHQVPFYETPSQPTPEEPSESSRIISICFITIDERCNRFFTVDNGELRYYQNTTYAIQKPAIVVIDLPSNGCETRNFPIIRHSELPDRIVAKGAYGFMVSVLDFQENGSCDDIFVYIANAFYNYLVVYDYKNDKFWAFEHQTFQPVIAESHYIFKNTYEYSFELGIFSIALGYPDDNGDRTAYYTDIAGTAQYAVSMSILKNRRKSPMNYSPDDFKIMGYLGCDHQPTKAVVDYTSGVMFYGEVQSKQVRCWNINKPLNPDYIDVVYESEDLWYHQEIAVDSRGYLWFHTCHIPIDYTSDEPLNIREVTSRTYRVKISDAIRGTVCENQ